MAAPPVARLLSGRVLDVDLSLGSPAAHGTPITAAKARRPISESLNVPPGCVCLVDAAAHEPLEDHAVLEGEVGVVVLSVDPEVERAAEASLLRACGVADMESLLPRARLDLCGKDLPSLPERVGELTALQALKLIRSELSSLPDSFGQLTALQSLSLSSNHISRLPESFGQLTAMQSLYLNYNGLESLPESFGQLTSLQTLFLNYNRLRTLPGNIGQLTALRELFLHNNELGGLPESIGQLAALRILFLSSNKLKGLPGSFRQLTALQELRMDSWLHLQVQCQAWHRTLSSWPKHLGFCRRYRTGGDPSRLDA